MLRGQSSYLRCSILVCHEMCHMHARSDSATHEGYDHSDRCMPAPGPPGFQLRRDIRPDPLHLLDARSGAAHRPAGLASSDANTRDSCSSSTCTRAARAWVACDSSLSVSLSVSLCVSLSRCLCFAPGPIGADCTAGVAASTGNCTPGPALPLHTSTAAVSVQFAANSAFRWAPRFQQSVHALPCSGQ
jgi:hypothetical protein